MGDLITIIINVYNGEKYVDKCLNCVLNQTYKNVEILIINDGSTDHTLELCRKYVDNRIRIISQENKGSAIARNIGMDNANGEYLYFLDIDDFIEKDTIEYLYNLCIKNNVLMSTCKSINVYSYDFVIKNKKEKISILSKEEMLKKDLLAIDSTLTIWNKLIKRELLNDLRFEERKTDDIAFTYKLLLKCDKVANSNQIKHFYLRNRNSSTNANNIDVDRYIDEFNAVMEKHKYIEKIYPKLLENDICILRYISKHYCFDNDILNEYLNKKNAKKIFIKYFSYRVFFSKLRGFEKIKIILFRINPRLCIFFTRKYQEYRYKKVYKI